MDKPPDRLRCKNSRSDRRGHRARSQYRAAYSVKSLYLTISSRAKQGLASPTPGLAIDPNFPGLYATRGAAEAALGRFEQAKTDVLTGDPRLSPRDPDFGFWHMQLGISEQGLGHFNAAIEEYHKSIDMGFRAYVPYAGLAALPPPSMAKWRGRSLPWRKPVASTPNSLSNG